MTLRPGLSSDSNFEPMAEGNEESDSSFDFNDSKLFCGDETEVCDGQVQEDADAIYQC